MDRHLRAVSPSANEVVTGIARVTVEATNPVEPRTATAGVRVFDRRGALVRGQVALSDNARRIEWRPAEAMPAGAYRLSVEELATPKGERIPDALHVTFTVVDRAAPLPDGLEVRAYRNVTRVPGGINTRPAGPDESPIALVKAIERRSGRRVALALDGEGKPIDVDANRRGAAEAHAKAYGKVTPALAQRLARERDGAKGDRRGAGARTSVAIWLVAEEESMPRDAKASVRERAIGRGGAPEPGRPRRRAERSEAVRKAVDAFTRAADRALGGARARPDALAPVVYAELTVDQIEALARHELVAAIFPYDPRGQDDLTASLAIAEATVPHNAGVTGTGIRVAVWERGPDQTGNLDIEAFYDTGQSQMSGHARMTTGIIKNTSATGPNGYAPDCDLFSANGYDNAALAWALGQGCTVISQSFHRDDEQTDPDPSLDDILKDWHALRAPYPTIVQASGNGGNTEYVNHKGYNSLTVGNHDDTATGLANDTVFRNPDSPNGDRELPEIAANGVGITVVGLTDSGTSFATPAVAGTAALIQDADPILQDWPEGTRAILLAGARRNVSDGQWWADVSSGVDGSDGSGALNARLCVDIARRWTQPDAQGRQNGYDTGRFEASDFDGDGFLNRSYNLRVPRRGPFALFSSYRAKAVFTWNSTIRKLRILGMEFDYPIGSELGVDVDLEVFDSGGALVAGSWSWDNSYEIAEWIALPGESYRIRPRRWSGDDASWFGIAWAAVPILRPVFDLDVLDLRTVVETAAGGG